MVSKSCYYDNSGKGNEHNLIENRVLVSEVYGAVGYNKENAAFADLRKLWIDKQSNFSKIFLREPC